MYRRFNTHLLCEWSQLSPYHLHLTNVERHHKTELFIHPNLCLFARLFVFQTLKSTLLQCREVMSMNR